MVKEFDKLVKQKRKAEKEILIFKGRLKDSRKKLAAVNTQIEMIKNYILGE